MSVLGVAPLVVYVTPEAGERVAFTYEETAQLLGVSKWVVRQVVAAGDLHVVELGPQVRRIPAWSIDRLLGRTFEGEVLGVREAPVTTPVGGDTSPSNYDQEAAR